MSASVESQCGERALWTERNRKTPVVRDLKIFSMLWVVANSNEFHRFSGAGHVHFASPWRVKQKITLALSWLDVILSSLRK